jgi:tRNA-dihydrouridine synthase
VRFSGYPVTVKMRLGPTSDRINIIETGLAARDAGAALLTLHARTASAQFGGSARWEHIGALKSAVDIPVCGNGDIQSPEDAVRMLVDTGCDAVMIGRAAVGNPWLLAGTVRALEQYPEKPAAVHPTRAERIQQALEQLQIAAGLKGERKAIREMLVHLHRYLKGIPGAARVRKELIHAESTDEVRGMLLPLAAKSD